MDFCVITVSQRGVRRLMCKRRGKTLQYIDLSGPCRPVFKTIAHLVGRIGSGVRVSAKKIKNARLVSRLGSRPLLVADSAGQQGRP